MQNIQALLLEPVGCLAEFGSAPFHEIAVRFFGRKGKVSASASRSYWHLLNLMEASEVPLDESQASVIEALEAEAVAASSVYEDVAPVLAELKAMGVMVFIASSLSRFAAQAFVEHASLGELLSGIWSRDDADGIKALPLIAALGTSGPGSTPPGAAAIPAESAMFLADTVEGINVARIAGVQPILMMNDPDEAQRLATYNPAGGVVSLHEIPDFIRLIVAQNQQR